MKKLFAVCLLAGLVTLAGCSSTQTASAQYIGMEAARSAALKDAGVTGGRVHRRHPGGEGRHRVLRGGVHRRGR